MHHKTFSRRGGLAKSEAKTVANRAKITAFWDQVRRGARPAPRRPRKPPEAERVGSLLASICEREGISLLEIFGSVARGEARRGSDVDLIAKFRTHPGLHVVEVEESMAKALGVPVHLLTRETVDGMTNPYRREPINRDRRVIYAS